MSARLILALDAMGGDHAPSAVVRGANLALRRHPQAEFLFFGREPQLRPMIDRMRKLRGASRIVHTDDVVSGDDKPSVALRSGRNSSMRLAINAVRDGEARAVISGGNTGALMAMAKFALKTLPGVDRPAISSFFPTLRGETVMLDMGANVVCDARNLVQFTVMGSCFASSVLGIPRPTCALLNVGSEEMKGGETLQEAASMLRSLPFPGEFVGFVEGDDLAKGTVDVVVTDGFVGNTMLKLAEGLAKSIFSAIAHEIMITDAALGMQLEPIIKQLFKKNDYHEYGGAPLLGFEGLVLKAHGRSSSRAIGNAIKVAAKAVRDGVCDEIRHAVAEHRDRSSSA